MHYIKLLVALITNVTSLVMSISGSWVYTISVAYNIFKDCENIKISVILVGTRSQILLLIFK